MISDVSDVEGMLFEDEPRWLYDRAKEADRLIIEIGSFVGKSTICLAQGAIEGRDAKVWSIDPHTLLGPGPLAYPRLIENLNRFNVRDQVEVLVTSSADAIRFFPETSASLIFIDGAHDYQNVCRDLDLYLTILDHGGIIAVHDCNPTYPGIMRAVKERLYGVPEAFSEIETRKTGSCIAWARKCP
jgi:predicted O-methyltransferase YrrM